MLFVCVQVYWLWQHLHQTQWQSGFKNSIKLPVRVPYQQKEGQLLPAAFISRLLSFKLSPAIKLLFLKLPHKHTSLLSSLFFL